MSSRRKFIKLSAVGLGGVAVVPSAVANVVKRKSKRNLSQQKNIPIVVSTWKHGFSANKEAWEILNNDGVAIDAVEKGVRVTESDPENRSVGLGGLPDRDGKVTLDACIMNERGNCGSVAFLQNIENPISVARKVMENTPHVMMVGEGALQFAREQGFPEINLLTKGAKKDWEVWLEKSKYQPVINVENHDTIGMLAIDKSGNISGACTTSGLAYKMHGRVGDSPIIGAGLFIDNEVGGACATGIGEAVIKIVGSHTVVELMRQGYAPADACKLAVERIIKIYDDLTNLQVGFLAIDKEGNYGGYSIYAGFNFAVHTLSQEEMVDSKYFKEW